ncbi:hypothetical protein GQ53DRAFT_860284 [Thozetella sp. PMI_491]|nr:hypothetical protein GQ53DRAFT_860284 [Thozetella sp. PMI_491]
MLDDFSSLKVESKKPETASGPGRPAEAVAPAPAPAPAPAGEPSIDGILSDDDFAKQLQAGMADLLGEIDSSPEMQAQFESIFKELGAAASAGDMPSAENIPKAAAPGASGSGSFQDTIRQTMERMQASGEQATAAASADSSDDFMAELLKQMEAGGMGGLGGPGGEGGEEEFSKMLLGMMEQLTNKEILYEPMKELDDKFPAWLEKNRATTPEADLKRYEEQRALVREIVAKFEEPTFKDENAADREYIVDRMQKASPSSPVHRQHGQQQREASFSPQRPRLANVQCRCKLKARHRPTWSETCHRHKML